MSGLGLGRRGTRVAAPEHHDQQQTGDQRKDSKTLGHSGGFSRAAWTERAATRADGAESAQPMDDYDSGP